MRIKIIRLIIYSLFLIVGIDLIYVQAIRGKYFYSLSVNNRIRVIPLEGRRGHILDRNGAVLADNRLAFNVSVIPQDLHENDKLFDFLSQTLNIKKNDLLQTFFKGKVTPFAPVIVAEDVDKNMAMILEENKFRFPGLYIQETFKRNYPNKDVGAHVLGYVGKISREKIEKLREYGYTHQSIVGYSGIEEYYDQYLVGKQGGQQIEVDSWGRQVRLLSIREPERGTDIQVTLDNRIQKIASQTLTDRKGTIIVMDLDTGAILGMVSSPGFDPNIFMDPNRSSQARMLFVDKNAPLLNRAIMGLYPPGSVFKTIVTLAGLKSGKIKPGTEFFCKGAFYLGRRRFRCAHVHGTQNLLQGIMHSCNVYFFNSGLAIGPDLIYKQAKQFNLGNLSNIDLPFEEKGNIPSRKQRRQKFNKGWYKGDTLNLSIGQGDVLVTPIQLVRMMATIARDGREVQPYLIEKIGTEDIVQFATVRTVRIKKEHFDILNSGLRSVVTDSHGTARLLNLKDFNVHGKTGTAQSVRGKSDHSWFVGYNTKGRTNIAFCVFLEYGGSSYNAVKLTRQLLNEMKKNEIL